MFQLSVHENAVADTMYNRRKGLLFIAIVLIAYGSPTCGSSGERVPANTSGDLGSGSVTGIPEFPQVAIGLFTECVVRGVDCSPANNDANACAVDEDTENAWCTGLCLGKHECSQDCCILPGNSSSGFCAPATYCN